MKDVIYYKDELNDDFADSNITPDKIDENYKYIHKNIIWNLSSFILYRIFAVVFFIYAKLKYGLQIENKKAIKNFEKKYKKEHHKKTGYFLYLNHTQEILDAFFPAYVAYPKRIYAIANAKNVSMKGTKTLIKMLGAIPIPDGIKGMINFEKAIKYYSDKEKVIAIYPEAHIWPYYTKIRNFKSVSFEYPYKLNKPVFSATTTYQRKGKKFRIKIYVDGPFYPDKSLNKKEAKEKLRNEVYEAMSSRAKNSNIEIIKYIKNID